MERDNSRLPTVYSTTCTTQHYCPTLSTGDEVFSVELTQELLIPTLYKYNCISLRLMQLSCFVAHENIEMFTENTECFCLAVLTIFNILKNTKNMAIKPLNDYHRLV